MIFLLCVISCAILYAIKGGLLGNFRRWFNHFLTGAVYARQPDDSWQMVAPSTPQSFVDRCLDGKVLSAFLFACLVAWLPIQANLLIGAAGLSFPIDTNPLMAFFGWILMVSPSMGEDVSATGGYRGGWGAYLTAKDNNGEIAFGRSYGVKKCLQRGIFSGAVQSLVFWNPIFILTWALYPVTAWAGISIEQKRTGLLNAPWQWHEWLCGGICVGLGLTGII